MRVLHVDATELPVDITDPASIGRLLDAVGAVDAVVSTAGSTPFGAWDELDREDWQAGRRGVRALRRVDGDRPDLPALKLDRR